MTLARSADGLLVDGGEPFGALISYRDVWILTPSTDLGFGAWRSAPHERVWEPWAPCGCLRWGLLVVELLRMTDGGRL